MEEEGGGGVLQGEAAAEAAEPRWDTDFFIFRISS